MTGKTGTNLVVISHGDDAIERVQSLGREHVGLCVTLVPDRYAYRGNRGLLERHTLEERLDVTAQRGCRLRAQYHELHHRWRVVRAVERDGSLPNVGTH